MRDRQEIISAGEIIESKPSPGIGDAIVDEGRVCLTPDSHGSTCKRRPLLIEDGAGEVLGAGGKRKKENDDCDSEIAHKHRFITVKLILRRARRSRF
jgi:hypothetical protein